MRSLYNNERIRIMLVSQYDVADCANDVLECAEKFLYMVHKAAPFVLAEQESYSLSSGVNNGCPFSKQQWDYMKAGWLSSQIGFSIGDPKYIAKGRNGHNPDFFFWVYSKKDIMEFAYPGYWQISIVLKSELYNKLDTKIVNRWTNEMACAMRATTGYIENVNRFAPYYYQSGIFGICRQSSDIDDIGRNLEVELPGTLWRMLCTEKHIEILGGIEHMKGTMSSLYQIDETVIGEGRGAWLQMTEDIYQVNDEHRLSERKQIAPLLPKIQIDLAVQNKKSHGRLADYPVYTEEEKKSIKEFITAEKLKK